MLENYIGLPFQELGRDRQGVDCWGLYQLFMRESLDLDIEIDQRHTSSSDYDNIESVVWQQQANAWRQVETAEPCDLILIRITGRPVHVGLCVQPGLMLHIERGLNSMLERYDRHMWAKRIDGFWRHKKMFEPCMRSRAEALCRI